jgi:hypothetical protein
VRNPCLTLPQVESPQSRSWAMGVSYGFQGPAQSSMTPAEIQPEDAGAFDEGVLAGQDAAINREDSSYRVVLSNLGETRCRQVYNSEPLKTLRSQVL